MSLLKEKQENVNLGIEKFNKGELVVSSQNLMEIRREHSNIATTDDNVINLAITNEIVKAFEYFNVDISDQQIEIIISDIKEQYSLYTLVEILQAIKEGRKEQTKIYGKLAPFHILEWVKNWSNKTFEEKRDETERIKSTCDRSDKYSESTNEIEAEVFKKLSAKFKVKKEVDRHKMGVALAQDEIYQNHLKSMEKQKKYNKMIDSYDATKHGDFEKYVQNAKNKYGND